MVRGQNSFHVWTPTTSEDGRRTASTAKSAGAGDAVHPHRQAPSADTPCEDLCLPHSCFGHEDASRTVCADCVACYAEHGISLDDGTRSAPLVHGGERSAVAVALDEELESDDDTEDLQDARMLVGDVLRGGNV